MFDYKLLSALTAVVEQGGFEKAAQFLGLSQSAVSQRIKLLEMRIGQPVLVRDVPPRPTSLGRRLLNHVQQVRLLEGDLQHWVPMLDEEGSTPRLRIAVNADSLAIWWVNAISEVVRDNDLLFDLVVEDQAVGLKRMRSGDVAACLCAGETPVAGARAVLLGGMRYLALASPAFLQRYFSVDAPRQSLSQAPAIVYGPDDALQHRFLQRLGIEERFAHHVCPSTEGFMQMVRCGLGWGLIPELQAKEALRAGELVELIPDHPLDIPLYWHYWRGSRWLEKVTERLISNANTYLVDIVAENQASVVE